MLSDNELTATEFGGLQPDAWENSEKEEDEEEGTGEVSFEPNVSGFPPSKDNTARLNSYRLSAANADELITGSSSLRYGPPDGPVNKNHHDSAGRRHLANDSCESRPQPRTHAHHDPNPSTVSSLPLPPEPRRDSFTTNGVEYVMITEVGGQLHSKFEIINKPRAFFKKGRVFMVLWPELAGNPESERSIYWKIRHFVVIRARATHCLCLPLATHRGRGAANQVAQAREYAPVIPLNGHVQFHPDEQRLARQPLQMKVEDASLSVDAMSRINFSKVVTVNYNLKIRNVGRIVVDSIKLMEEYFAESMGLTKS